MTASYEHSAIVEGIYCYHYAMLQREWSKLHCGEELSDESRVHPRTLPELTWRSFFWSLEERFPSVSGEEPITKY
jgi:hypothetical protein